jgi:hypothetical protein
MIYSNFITEEDFQLYYQDDEHSQSVKLNYDFSFTNDMFIGSFADPLLLDLPINSEINSIPQTSLQVIYPNPFNPATTISYQLAEEELVTIDIYNIKGQKVANLINEQQPAGSYQVSWQPQEIGSGIYLFRFKAGDYSKNSKLILLK